MNVTIAIPFFNAENFLAEAVKSVFAQTHQNWELILIDDGSTDNSLQIAKSIKDERVSVISDGLNLRLAARLNQVIEIAKYDIIVRMDADDLMMPDRIEKQLKTLISNNADLVTTGVYSVLNNLTLVSVRGQSYYSINFKELLKKTKGITHAAVMAKKAWYERNKYDENLKIAQDYDLWLRASLNDDLNIISLNEPLYIYREEDNVTKAKILKAYQNEWVMLKKYSTNRYPILYLKLFFKTLIVHLLSSINRLNILLNMRGKTKISDYHFDRYNQAISRIKSTYVNGFNE